MTSSSCRGKGNRGGNASEEEPHSGTGCDRGAAAEPEGCGGRWALILPSMRVRHKRYLRPGGPSRTCGLRISWHRGHPSDQSEANCRQVSASDPHAPAPEQASGSPTHQSVQRIRGRPVGPSNAEAAHTHRQPKRARSISPPSETDSGQSRTEATEATPPKPHPKRPASPFGGPLNPSSRAKIAPDHVPGGTAIGNPINDRVPLRWNGPKTAQEPGDVLDRLRTEPGRGHRSDPTQAPPEAARQPFRRALKPQLKGKNRSVGTGRNGPRAGGHSISPPS